MKDTPDDRPPELRLPGWALAVPLALAVYAALWGETGPVRIKPEAFFGGGWDRMLPAWALRLFRAVDGFVAGLFLCAVVAVIVRAVEVYRGRGGRR